MLTIDDESMLAEFEEAERQEPSPRKVIDSTRTIYQSRRFRFPQNGLWGHPVLCDFGEARIGKLHSGDIQPEIYRAPEVLFGMQWSFSVDIWNLGVMVREVLRQGFHFNDHIKILHADGLLDNFYRYGISLKLSTCSAPLIKMRSIRRHIMLPRWWHT
jgi:serine/threonine protein kinase